MSKAMKRLELKMNGKGIEFQSLILNYKRVQSKIEGFFSQKLYLGNNADDMAKKKEIETQCGYFLKEREHILYLMLEVLKCGEVVEDEPKEAK